MKLNPISEELEWRLFEWVEGNLTSEESAELELIISQDPNLKAHVEALKSTQLEINFSSTLDNQTKISLKHHTIKPISTTSAQSQFLRNKWVRQVAAAILVLIISTVVYKQNQPKTHGSIAEKQISSPTTKIAQRPTLVQSNQDEVMPSAQKEMKFRRINRLTNHANFNQTSSKNFALDNSKKTPEHPLIVATTLPTNIKKSNIEIIAKPQSNGAINKGINETGAPNIEEETIVMLSPSAKEDPKEFVKMAWGNVKEMMRQGKLPKIILSPVKTENNHRIPDVNLGIQVNQMSFVRTVNYNPTHN